MLRVRFKTDADDYRPMNWPIKHPYWCTGYEYGSDGVGRAIIVAYADDIDYIRKNWPEAAELDSTDVDGYVFTSRFPKPEWFSEVETLKREL